MTLRIESTYQQNMIPANCVICGRSSGGRYNPPVRHILHDDDEALGDVCERCAYGSVDLWKVAMIEYAIRLETKAAFLRSLAAHVEDGEPAPDGIAEDLIRANANQPRPRGGFPPFNFGD